MLGLTNNECNGAPGCTVVLSPKMTIEPGKSTAISVACPAIAPYVWGWDTQQNEEIDAELTNISAGGVTVTAGNVTERPGVITVFAGCSKVAWHGASFQYSRQGLPTHVIRGLGGRQ